MEIDAPIRPGVEGALPTLLAVDDEEGVLSALRRLFRPLAGRILTAQTTGDAFRILAAEPGVRIVLADYRMPDMNGLLFLRRVQTAAPDAWRVLVTGGADLPDVLHAFAGGVLDRLVTKPWSDEKLLALARHAFSTEAPRLTHTSRF